MAYGSCRQRSIQAAGCQQETQSGPPLKPRENRWQIESRLWISPNPAVRGRVQKIGKLSFNFGNQSFRLVVGTAVGPVGHQLKQPGWYRNLRQHYQCRQWCAPKHLSGQYLHVQSGHALEPRITGQKEVFRTQLQAACRLQRIRRLQSVLDADSRRQFHDILV